MTTWPPSLADLKADMSITSTRDDVPLQTSLDASVAYVEQVHLNRYDFDGSGLYAPIPRTFFRGVLMLAARDNARRRSVDGLVQAGDASARLPSFDSDIERLLKLGRRGRSIVG